MISNNITYYTRSTSDMSTPNVNVTWETSPISLRSNRDCSSLYTGFIRDHIACIKCGVIEAREHIELKLYE